MGPQAATDLVKQLAREVGLDGVGIGRAGPVQHGDFYRQWVAAGKAGSMQYLAANPSLRVDPRGVLPTARSVIVGAVSYHQPGQPLGSSLPGPRGRVAMYAWGHDYHEVLRAKLGRLVSRLAEAMGREFDSRVSVDSSAVLEKELAAAAGVGWIGKNTLVIHPRLGSYLFLGTILTSLELVSDEPMPDRCGRCRRCLEGCPTGALEQPYAMDPRRCVSYLTVELRGAIPEPLREPMAEWVFGCDLCQRACPYNRKAPAATEPAFFASPLAQGMDLREMVLWTQERYRRTLKGTAMGRATLAMMRRNAAVALGNTARSCGAELRAAAEDPDPLVAEHARWAIERLRCG